MDTDTKRRLVRAARGLLQWDQARFATALGVGTATIKRFEAGYPIAEETVERLMGGLRGVGVIVIERSSIAGLEVLAGVALLTSAEIGPGNFLRADAKPDVRKAGIRRPTAARIPSGIAKGEPARTEAPEDD